MIIKGFEPYVGIHCETTATGCLLRQRHIDLSEPMLFGLGEGLGFIFWKMKAMDFPFIGGRVKPLALTRNIARNLNLDFEVKETSSIRKAWKNVVQSIEAGDAVGLQLDSYHLDYFAEKFHFAGHFATLYGYDDTHAYLVDTSPNGRTVRTSLLSLEQARNEKGAMSAKNLMYTLKAVDDYSLDDAVVKAISNNAREYLNPPIKNMYYKGILKTSIELKTWFARSANIQHEFETTAMLMETAGTGGALFRNLYRDFLKEAFELTGLELLNEAHGQFVDIAEKWTQVAGFIAEAGKTGESMYVDQASEVLKDLSSREYEVMCILEGLGTA